MLTCRVSAYIELRTLAQSFNVQIPKGPQLQLFKELDRTSVFQDRQEWIKTHYEFQSISLIVFPT